jgi:hypothetical protein
MNNKTLVSCLATLLFLAWHPVGAQDHIPETSGFSGFVLGGAANVNVASSLLARGAPFLDYVGSARIESIFEAPSSISSPGVPVTGEINYTFANTRTQVFFGNRLEDLLRLDVVFGLGVRQEIGKAGILAVSYLITPMELQSWADPYVEGEDRRATDLSVPGFRIRWGEIFGTGLELTITDRFYTYQNESSGDWLIDQGRLDPEQQSLLDRDGDVLRIQALYRFKIKRHRFEPAVQWVDDYHRGAAIANTGYKLQLNYLYISPKVVLDVVVLYGAREAKDTNPIYGEVFDADRLGAALTAIFPVKKYTSSVLNVFVGGEVFRENANIDFYDSSIKMVLAGVIWRHIRK